MKRLRRRYIALKIHARDPCSFEALSNELEASFIQLFGLWGFSQAGMRLLNLDETSGEAVLLCWHKWLPMVRACATTLTQVGDSPAILQVKGVSGTIRRLRRKFLRVPTETEPHRRRQP